jgi:protein-S-isoprenylcysteine O-methyltransferase Ste14
MTDAPSMQDPAARHADRSLTAAVSLAVGAAFLSLWFWLLPQWLGFKVEITGAARWRWLAAIPSALGFAVALRCIWDFGWTGHGTPAPVAPPQKLVVVGFYRYVRNPMYVGFAAGWIGLWIISDTRTQDSLPPSLQSPSACICLWSFMKNQPCAKSSAQTTKTISETYAAGGPASTHGINRDDARLGRLSKKYDLYQGTAFSRADSVDQSVTTEESA